MAGEVEAAWIAAGASIAVSVLSLGTSIWTNIRADRTQAAQVATARDLAELTSRLSRENDAAKAKDDYEYEARKRLYAELYPLAYQLRMTSLGALHRIMNLALAARGGYLAPGEDNWLTGRDPYYFTSTVHSLISPLAVYELMTRRLTSLDLRLDRDLHLLQVVARQAYSATRSDYELVDPRYPAIALGPDNHAYAPPEIRPDALPPDLAQRWAWRQGLYSGQISEAVDTLLKVEGKAVRVLTYAEFARKLGGTDLRAGDDPGGTAGAMWRSLRPMSSILRDFHPARRPITGASFWRKAHAIGPSRPRRRDLSRPRTSPTRPGSPKRRTATSSIGSATANDPGRPRSRARSISPPSATPLFWPPTAISNGPSTVSPSSPASDSAEVTPR